MNESRVQEQMINGKWTQTAKTEDYTTIYYSLARDLTAKKINGCTWIKSIKRVQLYTGYIKIIVTLFNGYRTIYTVKDC